MSRVAIAALSLWLVWTPLADASIEYCKVIDISGNAEIQFSGSERWMPLSAQVLLKGGDKIRTPQRSYLELATSTDLSGLMLLSGNSVLEVMGDDLTRFFLRRGALSVLREGDGDIARRVSGEENLIQIFTPELVVNILQGGMSVSAYANGSWVRVFSEQVRIDPFGAGRQKLLSRTVSEGYECFADASSTKAPQEALRMSYSDYKDWQFWARKCYKRKDDMAQTELLRG